MVTELSDLMHTLSPSREPGAVAVMLWGACQLNSEAAWSICTRTAWSGRNPFPAPSSVGTSRSGPAALWCLSTEVQLLLFRVIWNAMQGRLFCENCLVTRVFLLVWLSRGAPSHSKPSDCLQPLLFTECPEGGIRPNVLTH